jgi:hypothetical protein
MCKRKRIYNPTLYRHTETEKHRTPTKHPRPTNSGNQPTRRAPRTRWWSKLADFRELYGSLAGTLAHVFLDAHLYNSSTNTMGQSAGQNAISAKREIGPIFDFFIFDTKFRELVCEASASNVKANTFNR